LNSIAPLPTCKRVRIGGRRARSINQGKNTPRRVRKNHLRARPELPPRTRGGETRHCRRGRGPGGGDLKALFAGSRRLRRLGKLQIAGKGTKGEQEGGKSRGRGRDLDQNTGPCRSRPVSGKGDGRLALPSGEKGGTTSALGAVRSGREQPSPSICPGGTRVQKRTN